MKRKAIVRVLMRSRAAQRGSMVVTTFVILMGLMVVVGGIHVFLQQQIAQSTAIQRISLAKLQALYLAEMGVNQVMYHANQAVRVNTPDPFPIATGTAAQYDFKANVAMTRHDAGGVARCVIRRTAANAFSLEATLTVTDVGTFTKSVQFTTSKPATQWVLANYTIQ
jgi:hypothetical protein